MSTAVEYQHFGNFDDLLYQLNAISKETLEPTNTVKERYYNQFILYRYYLKT
jgi:hypothetical protein